MPPPRGDPPDALLHRVIDDLTAVRALANLARHSATGHPLALAHLQHLDLIVMLAAARIQAYRLELSTPPLGVPPLCVA